uniref:CSTN1 n=1 Tax=Poecilia mexicana TaxID=48701 RepID=A0A3B3WMR0_9TELE
MRHGPGSHDKETILCNSDKTDMNRHHYSLYVHNCRLILLLRQDPSEAENYKPAEFHWKLDQVCDKEWHHYVLNVEFPTVSLFVDGTAFEPFMVTEDYPLHPSKIETQLTVGACWQENSGHDNDTEAAPETTSGCLSLSLPPQTCPCVHNVPPCYQLNRIFTPFLTRMTGTF